MDEKVLLEAIGQMMDAKLEAINQRLDKLETKMDEGFKDLTNLINEAAKDAAKTEKLLRKHVQQPIH